MKTQFLNPTTSIGETYLKILNELSFNVWNGFLEGFYSQDVHMKRLDCFGENAMNHLKSTLLLTESTTKQSFFFNLAKVVRNLVYLGVDIRDNCQVNSFLENVIEFCEEHCDGKKMMTRLTMNFSTLSKIYQEILNILYDTDPLSMSDEYALMQDLGNKVGEFARVASGYTYF